ncbi:hypothetical protein FRC08_013568 [Ceratobasidium sp. 394]|nr:hypothetical protein FRC08_013568 [Ceratobasidium sp. 394]
MVGGNYVAPLPRLNAGTGPQSMLDVCSGSGQWVFEIAQEFPFAKVVGIDLSKPTLGQESAIPSNTSFVVSDISMFIPYDPAQQASMLTHALEQVFPFESDLFDVVHMRMVPSIQERTAIYKEMYRILRPGQ